MNLNIHHLPKATIGVNIGIDNHHPKNNIFFCPPSTTPLIRDNFEVVSLIPFGWKPKPVLQQTYITNINPTYPDIIRRDDYSRPDQAIDQTSTNSIDLPAESAKAENEVLKSIFLNFPLLIFRSRTPRMVLVPVF